MGYKHNEHKTSPRDARLIPGRLFRHGFVSQKESPDNTILPATSGCETANPAHKPAVQPVA